MDNLKIGLEINGINLNNNFKIVTITLENALIYEKIVFSAQISLETKESYFDRSVTSLQYVSLKDGLLEYNADLVLDLIETTKPLWYDELKKKTDIKKPIYQG